MQSRSLNGGLAMMVLMSLLPIGLVQTYASVTHGFWYARSAEFIHQPLVHALVWLRAPGDIVFAAGVLTIAWFVLRLWLPPRRPTQEARTGEGQVAAG